MSRTRQEIINSTLLGNKGKRIFWPRRRRVGIMFPPGMKPLTFITKLLKASGFKSSDPESLRALFVLPETMALCRPLAADTTGFPDAKQGDTLLVLEQAILLGLCNNNYYDPQKTIIWTNNSLSRKMELFDVGDFYADD